MLIPRLTALLMALAVSHRTYWKKSISELNVPVLRLMLVFYFACCLLVCSISSARLYYLYLGIAVGSPDIPSKDGMFTPHQPVHVITAIVTACAMKVTCCAVNLSCLKLTSGRLNATPQLRAYISPLVSVSSYLLLSY